MVWGEGRKLVNIWYDHDLPHRIDKVFLCGLWNVGPILFNGCAKLLEWNRLLMPIQTIPDTLKMGDVSSGYVGHARSGMFSASGNCVWILATRGRALSRCIASCRGVLYHAAT